MSKFGRPERRGEGLRRIAGVPIRDIEGAAVGDAISAADRICCRGYRVENQTSNFSTGEFASSTSMPS